MTELKALVKRVHSEVGEGRGPVRLAIGALLSYVSRHVSRTAYERILLRAPGCARLVARYQGHARKPLTVSPVPDSVVREITELLGCVPKVGLEIATVVQSSGLPPEHYAPLIRRFVEFVREDLRIDLVKLIQSQTYDLTDLAKEVLGKLESEP